MKNNLSTLAVFIFILLNPGKGSAQSCDSLVPYYSIDLSSDEDSIWMSPVITPAGYCCGAVAPEKCFEIDVTISSLANGVIVEIYAGTITGSLFVKLDCSNAAVISDTVFFPTTGPHSLTVCRPGNGSYAWSVESVPGVISDIAVEEEDQTFIIYPNPAEEYITIESNTNEETNYTLFDVSGKLILSGVFSQTGTINLSSIPAGYYFIECGSGGNVSWNKIIVNN
jgi:hypothetical protein